MQKIKRLMVFLLAGLMLTGCGTAEPPIPKVTAGDIKIPVLQGSYCWSGFWKAKCVDMIAPPRLLKAKGYAPVAVPPETKLEIKFDDEPQSGLDVDYMIRGSWQEGSSSYVFAVEVR